MDFYQDALMRGAIIETPDELERKRRNTMLPRATQRANAGGAVTTTVQPGEENIRRAIELYGQEDDYSGAQDYARQRASQGEGALLNALAAGVAGRRFEPVQAMYLKRAMAAQEPMRVGSAIISPDGTVIKDPSAARERAADRFRQLGQFEQTLADRQEARQENADLRLAIAGMRGNGSGEDARLWRAEDKLRNDFENITKDLRTELASTRKITEIISATPPGGRPDAITQQSLVILLNKFLDPGSVVREGEFDRVVKAQGLEGRASNLRANLLRGEPLNDEAIRQINNLAQLYQQAAEAKMRSVAGQYAGIARSRGLDVGSVIMDGQLLSMPSPATQTQQPIIDLPSPR